MNDIIFDLKGNQHLTLFYDNDRYQEWRRQQQAEGTKKKKKKQTHVIPESDPAFVKFSGEEYFGKYLDLYQLHQQYLSFAQSDSNTSYLSFLQLIYDSRDLSWVPQSLQGETFLSNFIDYLSSFISRSMPLFDLPKVLQQISQNYENSGDSERIASNAQAQIKGETPDNFCIFCNKRLKNPEEFAQHCLLKSHLRKVAKIENKGGIENLVQKRIDSEKKNSEMRFTALSLLSLVRDKLYATIENNKRRQSATAAVIEAEQDLDAPIVFEDSDDEGEEHFYNPKGLPLGWDGKPIPYWLYKLHGLSVEYKCEICGNKSYWGAASFETHFFAPEHVRGLKVLGIPPTKHFLYITSIKEAQKLAAKLKGTLTKEVWQEGNEEIETEDGHVLKKSAYNDIMKQFGS